MPISRVHSAALHGVDAIGVEVEVNSVVLDSVDESPTAIIVGLPDTSVRESTQRVYAAIDNSGLKRPFKSKVTVNLAPADVRKEGPMFDLPIALGLIALMPEENGDYKDKALDVCSVAGELALDGRVRPVKGILSLTLEAKAAGRRAIIVPRANAAEASIVDGIYVYGVETLREAVELLQGEGNVKPERIDRDEFFRRQRVYDIDFADVKGQAHVKRALEVAMAGGHNLLMIGPPGTGKSMLAKRLATILPQMTEAEAIETTKIHSVAGLIDAENSFLATRPFRAPHHTISDAGLLGGSSHPTPGEVSLAHNGILFLDELPEFRRSTLEVMRQPLEDRKVTISRAAGKFTFPSGFSLVAAMNPCKCGYLGDPRRTCRCSPIEIEKYRQRISGPLLDRIDLHVDVPAVDYKELKSKAAGESSENIRQRVEQARAIQRERFSGHESILTNASMSPKLTSLHCALNAESDALLEQAMSDLNFSARAHNRILKVARTLADMERSTDIQSPHLLEAIQYRTLDRNFWA